MATENTTTTTPAIDPSRMTKAQLAALVTQLAGQSGVVTNGAVVPNTDTPKPEPQAAADRKVLDKIVARFGKDNGFGPSTGNVHWSIRKADRPNGVTAITIQTPDGARVVEPTVMTILGAMLGVTDFVLSKSVSGKSEVWTSAQAAKRIAAAGYTLTKRSKIWLPNRDRSGATRDVPVANVGNAADFLA